MTQALTALANAAAEEGTKAGNAFGSIVILGVLVFVGIWCSRKAIRIRDNAGGRLLNALIAVIAFAVAIYYGPKLF